VIAGSWDWNDPATANTGLILRVTTAPERTHLSLSKDAPDPREVCPPSIGEIVEFPEVGGLHHWYARRAA